MRDQADARSQDRWCHDDMVIVVATPLAPTIYGYSDRLRKRRGEPMTDRMFAQVDCGFTQAEHVDPVEQSARQELAARPTFGLAPRFGELSDGTMS